LRQHMLREQPQETGGQHLGARPQCQAAIVRW
jgi:hypothetical protein